MNIRGWFAGLSALCVPALALGGPPPVKSFTDFPDYELMEISSNGSYLAFTRHTTKYEVMTVLRLEDMEAVTQSQFGDRIDIASFTWANDRRLLIAPTRRFPGLVEFKVPTGEIIGMDADGKDAELLFGYQAGKRQIGTMIEQRQSVYESGEVLARLPQNSSEVLIQTSGYSIEGEFNSVYRMHVGTGELTKVAGSPIRNGAFLTDLARRVRLVSGVNRDGNNQVYFRPADNVEWSLLADTLMGDGYLWPVAPTPVAGEYFVLDDRDADTKGVFAWNPHNGARRLLFRQPGADVRLAGVDPGGTAWVFEYDDHFPRYWYPDDKHPLARLHQWLCTKFPDRRISITSQTDDLTLAVASVSGPRTPTIYYVVDVQNPALIHQLDSWPDLDRVELAAVEPIEFVARDGLKIRGYLTVPNGAQQKKLPMIVMVHGGPHSHDRFDFDPEVQLFASRGFAVLQVNFRGSSGRGRVFQSAGNREWAGKMQDDVTDGVRWAIGDGVADPKRICIYGISYGAFAALTGVYREPDLFRCAVGMAGVYDLPLMFRKGDIQTFGVGIKEMHMSIGTDMDKLERLSPVNNADKIRVPVLLLHGKADERAPYEHAKRMREALKKAGNPPEWSTEWGEGHGFFDEANRAAAYELMLAFFAKHTAAAGGN